MVRLRVLTVLVLLAFTTTAWAQARPDTGVARVVTRLEALLSGHRDDLAALLSPSISDEVVDRFAADFFAPNVSRGVVRERDRLPLKSAPPGDGYRLVVECLVEIGGHARILTARVDVQRPPGGDADSWRIVDLERLSYVEGLYRLRLDLKTQYAARELTIDAEDMRLTLHEGSVFTVQSDAGVTGLVLLGRGELRFAPPSQTEKGQMRIFAGADVLTTPFDSAFVRVHPDEYATRVALSSLAPATADARIARRAVELFSREGAKAFSLDLSDLSSELWYLIPAPGDFLADIRTRKYGTLTYSRSASQAEDITLFNRERRKTISLYPSVEKLASRGPSYDEDALADVDITAFEIDATVDPERESIEGRARVTLRTRVFGLSTLTLRLADSLNVTRVTSEEYGRLSFLRVRNQNGLLISLPTAVGAGTELTLVVSYAGRVESQSVDAEGLALAQAPDDRLVPPERKYLISNRSSWYPQNSVSDYATARLRIVVPDGYRCVASGQQAAATDVTLNDLLPIGGEGGQRFIFTAAEPVRYLSLVVSRFVRVVDTTISAREEAATLPLEGEVRASQRRSRIALTVEANPRQRSRGRDLAPVAEDIMRFYGTLMNDTPYGSISIALVEDDLPGGHSPGYAAVLNAPPPTSQFLWRNDPAAFQGFPEFFIAHELAHQWWGQAVGWTNYHEQWISEGFAQYFSALYAQRARGDGALTDMLRQFRRWALADSDEGPIYLGYRLGHLKSDTRVFRALVYNKGAGVLHMLRRLIGDEAFFDGLRSFYVEQKFRKAGTDDLRRTLEAQTGRPLDRFFDRWIYGSGIPRLRYATTITDRIVTVRFEQQGDQVFDLPVTVTLVYADGRTRDVMVPVTDKHVEQTIPIEAPVRQVQINRDSAALAHFDGL